MEAPYGYTATGRIRKKPIKGAAPLAVPIPESDNLQKPKKFVRCPVTTCKKDFKHRKDPYKAVWQHLLHHAKARPGVGDPVHKAKHAALKKERKAEAGDKKTRERKNSARWKAKNVRKAKRSSAMGTAKLKFERELRRAEEFSEEALEKLVDEKMADWDLKN